MNLSKYNYSHNEMKGLKELDMNVTYPISGFKFANSKYGEFVILNSTQFDIALPGRMCKMFREIEQSPEDMTEINSGRVGINVYEYNYDNQFGKGVTRGIEFTDLPF